MARPTKLNDITERKILDATGKGLPRDTVAKLAGIEPSTLYLWLRKGRAGDPEYSEFSASVKRAEAQGEAELVATIRAASSDSWQAAAWLLERRRPERWGQRRHAEARGPRAGEESRPFTSLSREQQVATAKVQIRELQIFVDEAEGKVA